MKLANKAKRTIDKVEEWKVESEKANKSKRRDNRLRAAREIGQSGDAFPFYRM